MRTFQFWILLIGSLVITGMVYQQIRLSKSILQQQHALVDDQELITNGVGFENTWKTMARFIYENGKNDPKMLDILKNHHIGVGPQPMATNSVVTPAAPAATPTHP